VTNVDGMLGRLLIGIVKGIILGALLGVGLAQIGFAAPGALIAYPAAALAGVLVGLVAGKPIWAKDAKIEAGMKAFVGALLGAGLMFAARKWLTMGVPVPLGAFGGANASLNEAAGSSGTLGGLAVTSLAMIAALLGGFYEADNDSDEGESKGVGEAATGKRVAGNTRVAASAGDEDLDEELADEGEKKRARK
jgi:hypothetical protein